jgi:hypothetical protein
MSLFFYLYRYLPRGTIPREAIALYMCNADNSGECPPAHQKVYASKHRITFFPSGAR